MALRSHQGVRGDAPLARSGAALADDLETHPFLAQPLEGDGAALAVPHPVRLAELALALVGVADPGLLGDVAGDGVDLHQVRDGPHRAVGGGGRRTGVRRRKGCRLERLHTGEGGRGGAAGPAGGDHHPAPADHLDLGLVMRLGRLEAQQRAHPLACQADRRVHPARQLAEGLAGLCGADAVADDGGGGWLGGSWPADLQPAAGLVGSRPPSRDLDRQRRRGDGRGLRQGGGDGGCAGALLAREEVIVRKVGLRVHLFGDRHGLPVVIAHRQAVGESAGAGFEQSPIDLD